MGHNHSHDHGNVNYNRSFAIGVALNVIYIIVEATYGIIINSLALIADAGHNLSDVLGLLLAWGASYLVTKKPTQKHTYGFKKSSVLAAFLNALILLVAIGGIVWEAIGRFNNPEGVEGTTIMIVAGIGVVINTATAIMFMKGREKDINIKGAFLHMTADAAISLGVVIVGLALTYTTWYWLDPVVSILIALVIFFGTWGLLKDSVNLALDAVPKNINIKEVEEYLREQKEVCELHDLHIWAMSTTETALTVHIVNPNAEVDDSFTSRLCHELHDKFGIDHSTIQIEKGDGEHECHLADDEKV